MHLASPTKPRAAVTLHTRVGVVMKSINGVSCNLKIESIFAFRSYTMAAAKADFNVL